MKTEKLTVEQYAKRRQMSPQAITQAIRKKNLLPDVAKVERFGRAYLLTVKKEII